MLAILGERRDPPPSRRRTRSTPMHGRERFPTEPSRVVPLPNPPNVVNGALEVYYGGCSVAQFTVGRVQGRESSGRIAVAAARQQPVPAQLVAQLVVGETEVGGGRPLLMPVAKQGLLEQGPLVCRDRGAKVAGSPCLVRNGLARRR